MSLSIKRVELSNIRSHEHFVFEPSMEGITSIVGSNGAGKSTIVDSIAWALYGTKPSGVSKASSIYRDGADFKKDKCFVAIDLNIYEKNFRVIRRMVTKAGALQCEVLEEKVNSSGETVWETIAGPSLKPAEDKIRSLLKMDEKGFLASVLIQQKQVDQLISATPAERRLVIEKLTGISSITEALKEARQDHNALRKAVSFSTVDRSELEKLIEEKTQKTVEIENLREKFEKLDKKLEEMKVSGKELKDRVEIEEENFNNSSKIRENITRVESAISIKEATLEDLLKEKDAAKKRANGLESGDSFLEVEKQRNSLIEKIASLSASIEYDSKTLNNKKELLKGYSETISRSDYKTVGGARRGLKSLEKNLSEFSEMIRSARDDISSGEASIGRISRAIETISDSDNGGECPTCLQKVEDIETAVTALSKEREGFQEKILVSQEKLREAMEESESIEKQRIVVEELIEAFTNFNELEDEIKKLEKVLHGCNGELKAVESEKKSIDKVYASLKETQEAKKEYNRLLENCQKVSKEIDGLRKDLDDFMGKAGDSKTISREALVKLREKLEKERAAYMKVNNTFLGLKSEVKVAETELQGLTDKIEKSEEEIEKHQELLKSVEILSNSVDVLNEFRDDRIEKSVPLLENYASDFLSKFTQGRFTGLRLDGKFNASVVMPNGKLRPVGLLSGGELSAAAMAMRLGISKLLNNAESQSLLIMDEVLVSQDVSRSEQILSTIKESCEGQIIMIAHNESINDFADDLIEL